jgi:hypothetical protein
MIEVIRKIAKNPYLHPFLEKGYGLELLLLLHKENGSDGIDDTYARLISPKPKPKPASFYTYVRRLISLGLVESLPSENKKTKRVLVLSTQVASEIEEVSKIRIKND